MNENFLEMKKVGKLFPGTVALEDVDFSTVTGEVHVLIGENGAGKSTLMKILCGIYGADSGEIFIEGKKVNIRNIEDSQALGIGIVHQELNLLPNKTVYQNIFLGRELYINKALGIVDEKKMIAKSAEILEKLGIDLSPMDIIWMLSISQQQMVEVARALMMNARLLIMDEPTSSLTKVEIDALFRIVNRLKAEGTSIVYISHRMEEIFEIGDRVTVLRDGRYVMTANLKDIDMNDLVSSMVGKKISDLFGKRNPLEERRGEVVMKTDKLTGARFRNCSIEVHKGEVVSLAGLIGAGRTELARAIFGYDKVKSGTIELYGEQITNGAPHKSVKKKVGFLSEDRKGEGIILTQPIRTNVVQASLERISTLGYINGKKEEELSQKHMGRLNLTTNDLRRHVITLSGGNQQKVAVAKWLCAECDIFIFDEPTRGIDVGAKAEIYQIINNLANSGAAILLISSDQMEVVGVSDRTYVMKDGDITGELHRGEISPERILELAL